MADKTKAGQPQKRMPLLALTLLSSLCVTEALILLESSWANALPLHLCSLSALAALGVALGARGMALDFLWYLGMPGALLALLFPAPAMSRWQTLLNASYVATHALILLIPLRAMLRGDWPRRGRAADMMILLQAVALLSFFVNRALGTDFLFLMAPPAGTPLIGVFRRGYWIYLLALQAMMLLLCLLMQEIRARLRWHERD